MRGASVHSPSPLAITGLGLVSPLGSDVDGFFDALAAGQGAIEPQPELAAGGHRLGARVRGFEPAKVIPTRRLRRLSRLAQMAVVAARQAFDDACLSPGDSKRIGVVVGTGLGALEQTVEFLRGYFVDGAEAASPSLFPGSVMNAAAAQITMELGLRGYCTTVNHKDASALSAVALAADVLALGRADAVLVGGVDELTPALHHGYRRLGLLSPRDRDGSGDGGGSGIEGARPYDQERNGLVLGEGAVILVLEPGERARRRGARVRGWLAGVGLAGDTRSQVGWQGLELPRRDERTLARRGSAEGAVAAIAGALAEAGLSPDELGYVAGGANGSRALDRLEVEVLRRVLGEAAVPVSSILGASGEFMSSAALRLASVLFAFERGILPGTVGLTIADAECRLPGLRVEPGPGSPASALVASFASGGADVALVLTREAPSSGAGT